MYDLKPKAVYAHKRVFENPQAVERMNRILEALDIDPADVPRVDMADLDTILETAGTTEDIADYDIIRGGHGRMRQGHFGLEGDPVIVFNTFVWDESEREEPSRELHNIHAKRLQRLFAGVGEDFAWSRREIWTPWNPEYVCQGGWGIHTLAGCVHKCDYCQQAFIVTMMLDIEDFAEHLEDLFRRRPEQLLYRYDLYSDILAFEPEYGASEVLAESFARYDKYLLLYTRSHNVAWLADLDHRDHVLANWTLAMETQAREIEHNYPSLAQRIEAMRTAQEMGYVVRAGFSPVIPVADWRRETTEMLESLFVEVRPEVLRAWVLSMMEADEFERLFDVEMMDPKFIRRMREETGPMAGTKHAPFPEDVRAEIYSYYIDEIHRLSPETPFNLCTEHPRMWEVLAEKLSMTPSNMFCCCGGLSVPRAGGKGGG